MLMYGVSCLSEEHWMGVHADARRVIDKRRSSLCFFFKIFQIVT